MLNTPVISLKSPFSEMPVISGGLLRHSKLVASRKHLRLKKKKRRSRSKRSLPESDSDSDSGCAKRAKILDCEEVISLQIQRAMIADEDGDRPIHIAVAQEDSALVKKLCELMKAANATLDPLNHLRQTPLHVAVIVGSTEAAEVLLENGASLSCEDRRGNNAVQLSVKYFREDIFFALLKHRPPSSVLNCLDYEGFTALHHAVKNRNEIAVRGLHDAGADINAVDGKSGRTALAHAVIFSDQDMITLLLQIGACVDVVDYSGQSALELALQTGNRTVIKLLEKKSQSLHNPSHESEITHRKILRAKKRDSSAALQ